MADFLLQDAATRREVLQAIAARFGHSASILEKDVWIVWTLDRLFAIPGHPRMAFKGGTSLSKAFRAIDRFSEDVDVSLHYQDGAKGVDPHTNAMSKSQVRKLGDNLRAWVSQQSNEVFAPFLRAESEKLLGAPLTVEVDESGENLKLHYPSALVERDQYHREFVLIELGGRNEAEPSARHTLNSYLSEHVNSLVFPEAVVDVLSVQRTFWEKATAIHDMILWQQAERCEGFSRHLSDVVQLWQQKDELVLMDDLDLLARVCHHKTHFWSRGHSNYAACLSGEFRLTPADAILAALKADYARSVTAGMYFQDPKPFDQIIDALAGIETTINEAMTSNELLETEPVVDRN